MKESVKVKFTIDNGITETKVKAVVTFPLVDNGFSHPWGYEPRHEIDTDRPDIKILSCTRTSPWGEAEYYPTGALLVKLNQEIIKRAIKKIQE